MPISFSFGSTGIFTRFEAVFFFFIRPAFFVFLTILRRDFFFAFFLIILRSLCLGLFFAFFIFFLLIPRAECFLIFFFLLRLNNALKNLISAIIWSPSWGDVPLHYLTAGTPSAARGHLARGLFFANAIKPGIQLFDKLTGKQFFLICVTAFLC